jgi:hypothetical protein
MENNNELKNRLGHIQQICEIYLETPGFPKDVVIKHVIDVAKGDISHSESDEYK